MTVEANERVQHGTSFGAVAAAYAEHRPDYAEAAVRWALAPAGPHPRVLDLGAGTGKLTAMLAAFGADVTAVEPDPAMFAELRRVVPAVRAMPGSAEAIPLADASVDAVLCAQAMHWFDMDTALPEIARVLVPGGVLAGLWNSDDDRVPWVAGLDRVSEGAASTTLSSWRAATAGARLTEMESPQFGRAERAEFEHGQRRTADSLVATVATHSRLLVMELGERERLLAQIRSYLDERPETRAGEFTLPMVTVVIRAIRA
ncbi:MAG: class I SAM-dependent methyltransferase [Streptosporangiaceae bacterium]|nr:class I SAM-dependent methyltransferase [Streptosporangiaceae bacterium]MBV9858104.1 class I SAM-dependent methyltransferase [Streptosporangiaceae bacterium]